MNEYKNEIDKCCSNAQFTLDKIAELEAELHKKESEIAYLKEKIKYMNGPESFKYTPEMALFEIWGALNMAKRVSEVKFIARKAMIRANMLEE